MSGRPGQENDRRKDEASIFTARVIDFLGKIEYRHCHHGEDFEQICRLRYRAYSANGLVTPGETGRVADLLDDSDNCFNFGVFHDGTLISTLRIHHVTAEAPWAPSLLSYADLIQPRLQAGESFVDPSRFASDPEWARNAPEIPFVTLRLAVIACIHFNVPYCLSTIRPEHAAFYRRIYRSTQIGPLREYPHFTRKVGLYQADVETIRSETFTRYPFFRSSPVEQKLLFSRAEVGGNGPLTVVPMLDSESEAA